VTWLGAGLLDQVCLVAAREGGPARELRARRRLRPVVLVSHLGFVLLVGSGLLAAQAAGLHLGQTRWLGLKAGLTAFLFAPLVAFHAWVNHVWIARGLRQTPAPPFSKDLRRGLGMDDMGRTLMGVFFAVAVPLAVWLSLARPR
jgi:hypothetical protein